MIYKTGPDLQNERHIIYKTRPDLYKERPMIYKTRPDHQGRGI